MVGGGSETLNGLRAHRRDAGGRRPRIAERDRIEQRGGLATWTAAFDGLYTRAGAGGR